MAWKKRLKIMAGIGIVLVVLMLASRIVLMRKARIEEVPTPSVRHPVVQTAMVEKGKFSLRLRYLGTLRPKVSAEITSRITGRIVKLDLREGARVKKGDILVTLDDRLEKTKVDEMRARLHAAKTNFHTQDGIYRRDLMLFKQKALSREELDLSKARREAARGELKALEAGLESALTSLSYTIIKAPFCGVITKRYLDPGDLAIPGKPILELESENDGFYVEIKVPQDDFMGLRVGQRVWIFMETGQGSDMIEARISRLQPILDRGTLAVVEADLAKRPFGLPTGSILHALISKGEVQGVRVPIESLMENVGKTFCYFLDGDNRVHIEEVHVLWRGEEFAILKELGHGIGDAITRVIVAHESALLRLHRGDEIKPSEMENTF